ncbi:MAG TPA: AmmeMemoRadiSam system protein A [Candidatus Polarisedimenticolia bacterium]|nr:AmmeMemoRadiSam system protein A [Candidatus Polarisedimenticolia bacterium]
MSLLALIPLMLALAGAQDVPPPAPTPSGGPPASTPPPVPAAEAPAPLPDAPLEPAERDTLLRLAWQTLVGHLTDHPIKDQDLEAYDLTPRLQERRGCFLTLKKGGQTRGSQGEIEPTRPLYQQVIVFTRRAATRDPRFVPLTDLDLEGTTIEIAIIGHREKVDSPAAIGIGKDGLFLEKWGRRALFLPELPAASGWSAERALDELCRQASLPAGAWSSGARLEIFKTEVIAGKQPPPRPVETPAPPIPAPLQSSEPPPASAIPPAPAPTPAPP